MRKLPLKTSERAGKAIRTPASKRELLRFSNCDQHALSDVLGDFKKVFETRYFVEGTYAGKLERKLSERYGRPVVATNSGTTALILALDTLLKDKREVIVPSLTFNATIQAVIHAGAIPVFADVDAQTWAIDARDVANKITGQTGAILPVNLFGVPADHQQLKSISETGHIPLLYDSCQAFGSQTPQGEIGTLGDIEAFSLDATKIVSGGLGGFITVKDRKLFPKLREGKNFGNDRDKRTVRLGINGRLSEFNAILALRSLETVGARLENTKENALRYRIAFSDVPRVHFQQYANNVPVQQYFALFIESDPEAVKRIRADLLEKRIETRIYNPTLLHHQRFFTRTRSALPQTEKMHGQLLCLPMHEKVNGQHVDVMVDTIARRVK